MQDDRVSGVWDSMCNPQSAIRSPQSIMSPLLFWTFALLMLVFGVAVVANRNPVASALSLVVSFLGLAALFMSLDAYFIGIIQVLVYAGAVMVLFLFIIMLLDLRAQEGRQISWFALIGGITVALALLAQILYVIHNLKFARQAFPPLAGSTFDDVRNVGLLLFGSYNLPFQIIGVLVLVATIGVVLLSKREPR
jgi:NADH-quinone oxidoreductase subunit J